MMLLLEVLVLQNNKKQDLNLVFLIILLYYYNGGKMKKLFLSFFIPFIILLFLFFIKNIIIGDNSILYGDAQYQYYQLLLDLKRIFEGNSNLFYTFKVGFGSAMLPTIAYYLISPFNILVNFFSFENMEYLFLLLVLLKISLCGLTMYIYLNYNLKNKYTLLFSTAYALSSYIIVNYFQIMWLDVYFLAPLILLGIDKIIKEKKYLLYGITLFLSILFNYYMGYMCCIFSVLYFIYKYLLNEKKDKKMIKRFVIISILAGLMTFFLHLPHLLELIEINRTSNKNYWFNFNIIEVLSKFFIGNKAIINNEFYPHLYIGLFNVILLFFYFVNNNISKREKILSLLFLLILLLSVIIVPLNNFWHAFSYPIGFNFRYMFLFNIVIISICLKSFGNLKFIDKKWYYVIFLIILILSNLIIFSRNLDYLYVFINVFLIMIYLFIFKIRNKDTKILFCILVIAELFFNNYIVLNGYSLAKRYYIDGRFNEKMNTINSIKDNSFYRMEFERKYAFNDPLNYGYYGVTGWLSSSNVNYDFYDRFGYYTTINMAFYNHFLVLDSLFGIKYYEAIYELPYYDLLKTNQISVFDDVLYGISYQNSYLYQNPYVLGLGYMVDSNIKNGFECTNAFECQNELLKKMTGLDENVYKENKVSNEIVITDNLDFYILVDDEMELDKIVDFCVDKVGCYELNFTSNRSFFIKNTFDVGYKLKVSANNDIYIAYFDIDKFINHYDILKNNQLNITSFKENHIKGNINVKDNKTLFLSINYDADFKILVDGKETNYYKVLDNFIGLDLSEGYHDIEIKYEVKGFKLGLIISLISSILFIIFIRRWENERN